MFTRFLINIRLISWGRLLNVFFLGKKKRLNTIGIHILLFSGFVTNKQFHSTVITSRAWIGSGTWTLFCNLNLSL